MDLVRQSFTRGKEDFESQHAAKRYNPATTVAWKYRRREYKVVVSSGTSDQVYVYRTVPKVSDVCRPVIYVLSYNSALGYVGAQRFSAAIHAQYTEDEGGVFWECEAAERALGKGWDDLHADELIHKVLEYMPH